MTENNNVGRDIRIERPQVKLPPEIMSTGMIVCVTILSAIGLFLVLNNNREVGSTNNLLAPTSSSAIYSPPELKIPDTKVDSAESTSGINDFVESPPQGNSLFEPSPSISIAPVPQQPPPSIPQQDLQIQNQPVSQPTVLADQNFAEINLPSSSDSLTKALVFDRGVKRTDNKNIPNNNEDDNSAFNVIRPEQANLSPSFLTAGTLIPAVLETSLDTSRNGLARAMVTKNIDSFDGSNTLIPRGSRLIGQYSNEVTASQKRVLVTWNRLVLPDGRQVRIDSPSTDKNGAPGIRGKVKSNAVGRFFTSFLQTVVNVATFRAINSGGGNSVLVTVPGGVTGTTQELIPQQQLRRKITVPAGAELTVFVSQDIDFAEVNP